MNMRRRVTAAGAVGVSLLLLAACGTPQGSETSGVVEVTALTIGYPDEDGVDATSGGPIPGIRSLEDAFNAAHDDIELKIVNIPWGEGSTGYAAKTEAMIQAEEACVYEMPAAQDYGRRGFLRNLDDLISADAGFENVWGPQLDTARESSADGSLWYIPSNTGERVINWDAKIFQDWGVEPLSKEPTLEEIAEKAPKLTGINPVTGEQNYGYWYQGKYAVWQFLAIAHSLGAEWGEVKEDGTMSIDWNTPEYLEALEWMTEMARYAPQGALASEAMPDGFLTDTNVVGIIPEGEAGYFLNTFKVKPDLSERFRTSYNLKGDDGLGGLSGVTPVTISADCETPAEAFTVLKWLAGSKESQKYYYDSLGRLPVTADGAEALPEVAALTDGDVILGQPLTAEAMYPWASEDPRWALQSALEATLAGTLSPAEALTQAQTETEVWLSDQGLNE